MARRKNFVTSFLSDIVDDTKEFVDDLLDRAKDVEEDVRDAVRKVVDDDEVEEKSPVRRSDRATTADIKAINAAIAELTLTVNRLTAAQVVEQAAAAAPRRNTRSAA